MSFDDLESRSRPFPSEDYLGNPLEVPPTFAHYTKAIAAGLRVFPLHRIVGTQCACGDAKCEAAGKHPLTNSWQHTPDWSDEQIECMETAGQFATGYGILVRGLLVIDVDARNGGVASYARLISQIGAVAGAGLIVNTGSGGGSKHLYFRVPDGLSLMQHHADFGGVDFKSSGYVCGPGSLHKSGNSYTIAVGGFGDIEQASQSLIDMLKKHDRHRGEVNGSVVDVSHADIADMLASVDPDAPHEVWLRCGMACHHATDGAGFALWDEWSGKGSKYPGSDILLQRWHSFGKSVNPTTIGTLMHYASEAGWKQSVTFETTNVFEDAQADDASPFDVSGIDLLRPPGFVGEVASWFNSQCRYPREHLAVAGALVSVGNIIGLRYIDDRDGVTANLFAFCVAGSGTGKEAILQAVSSLHRCASIHRATHGSIKSEQEIVRNLTRHQASYYVIDEVGILLAKIENAKKKGGAAYLDGVIGILMQAYSKANSFMLLTGDMKDLVRTQLVNELAQARSVVENNEDKSGQVAQRIPTIERALSMVDNGLERPFLSMIGFTTPVTFDDCMTADSANNGFIGRSILVRELETNPRGKRGFRANPNIPAKLESAIWQLCSGGAFHTAGSARVENYEEPSRVPTSPDADEMLGRVALWLEDHAEGHKETTGFEAIVRRTYEHISKVSFILATPSGLRTAEHVRWAVAYCIQDMRQKITKVFSADSAKDRPGKALQARILTLLGKQDGASLATITNRIRTAKSADIAKAIEGLKAGGQILEKTSTHPTNGRTTVLFFEA